MLEASDGLVIALVVRPFMASSAGPYMSYALDMSSVDMLQLDMDLAIDIAVALGGCPMALRNFMASSAL